MNEAWYQQVRDLRAKYIDDKIALGACSALNCIHPARDGLYVCRGCAARSRNAYHRRVAQGLCGHGGCDQPPDDGVKLCAVHRKQYQERARRQRRVRNKNKKNPQY